MDAASIGRLLVVFLLIQQGALAQSGAESTDRPSARKPDVPGFLGPSPPSGLSPPQEPETVPSPEPENLFTIKSYAFEGNTVFSDEELQRVAAPFTGKPIGVADLEELRQRLTRHYIDHGYINSGAIVPPDPLRNGIFYFRIVEGRLEDIRLKGNGRLREGYIKNRLLNGTGNPLNLQSLEDNFQLLLGDPLIERMNGRLLPGSEPGRSILDLEVTRARPYQLSVFGNNYRPPSIGAEAIGVSGWVRNLTGLGDFLNASAAISEGATRYYGIWSLPVTDWGTQIYFSFDEGRTSVIEEPLDDVDIDSEIHALEGGISHPVIESLRRRLVLGASFAVRENETRLLGEPFSFVRGVESARNQATVLRFAQDYIERWEQRALALRSTFSVGLDALGATPETNEDFPDSEFFAWLGQVQYVRRVLDNGAQVVFRGDMQFSNEPLLPLEQIAVGGVASVRGYRENQLVRDQGYSGSIEFHYPLFGGTDRTARNRLVLIPFMDYGAAWNHGEDASYLHSVGIGFNWTFHHFRADFYWAHPIKDPPQEQHDDIQDEGIHFQVGLDAF